MNISWGRRARTHGVKLHITTEHMARRSEHTRVRVADIEYIAAIDQIDDFDHIRLEDGFTRKVAFGRFGQVLDTIDDRGDLVSTQYVVQNHETLFVEAATFVVSQCVDTRCLSIQKASATTSQSACADHATAVTDGGGGPSRFAAYVINRNVPSPHNP